ncbi:Phosphatidate phosphatase LPIN3, partial [Fasciola gigantica]
PAGDAYFVDSDAYSSDDENYSTVESHAEGAGVKWPGSVTRRRRRKVRRDSAMSEPDASTLLEDLENDDAIRSDSEQLDIPDRRTSLVNHFGSDGFLIDSLNSINESLDWPYGGLRHRRSEQQSHTSSQSGLASEIGSTSTPKFGENNNKKLLKSSPLKNGEVYLEDLVTSEVDPTVKEVYIYPPIHPGNVPISGTENYSHRSAEANFVDAGYRSDGEHSPRSLSPIYPTIYGLKLSLCGCSSNVSEEKFVENLVFLEDFIKDPESVLTNPNLTVQLNDKYLSWALAAPSIVSILAFQTELPHRTVRQLENVHMSKKQTRKTSWFSWGSRRVEVEENEEVKAAEIVVVPEVTKEQTPVISVSEASDPNSETETKEEVKTHSSLRGNRLSSSDIMKLRLKKGRNDVEFRVTTKYQGTCICSASIFVWHWSDQVVISDVDGTITRSDLLGHLLPLLGHDWTHDGVARLYSQISSNGYRFIYLSARALGQAGITRSYLRQVVQGDFRLPDGPVLLSPNSLLHALHQEVIEKKPENFKIKCLRDVTALFPETCHPLYAGFGNKNNDVFAYEQAGIERCRIFTVNPRGELRNEYNSVRNTSYRELHDSVEFIFPFIVEESRIQSPVSNAEQPPDSRPESCKAVDKMFRRSSVGVSSVDMSTGEDDFQQATEYLPRIADKLEPDVLLYFYARFKQATVGPCNIPKPGFLDFNGRKKWQAWKDVESMSSDQARAEYVSKLQEVDSSWDPKVSKGPKGTVYVSRMLILDPEPNEENSDDQQPIFTAVKNGDLEHVKSIIEETPGAVFLRDIELMTPLHWAADRGLDDIASLLLAHSADINAQDEQKQTPMHYACCCGHLKLAKLLYKSGADVSITDQDGQNPIELLEEHQKETLLN